MHIGAAVCMTKLLFLFWAVNSFPRIVLGKSMWLEILMISTRINSIVITTAFLWKGMNARAHVRTDSPPTHKRVQKITNETTGLYEILCVSCKERRSAQQNNSGTRVRTHKINEKVWHIRAQYFNIARHNTTFGRTKITSERKLQEAIETHIRSHCLNNRGDNKNLNIMCKCFWNRDTSNTV